MDRKALSVCTSVLVLVVLASSVGLHALRMREAEPVPRPPRLLSEAKRAAAGPLHSAERSAVTPTGLIEAAVPPTTTKKKPATAEKTPTIKLNPGQPTPLSRGAAPKPTKIAPVSPRESGSPIVLRPVEPNAAAGSPPAGDSPFRFRDGASAVANPQLPRSPSEDRVMPPRSALAAPSIAPAVQPTVPPKMPLVVPAPAAPVPTPAVVSTAPKNELKVALPEPTPAAAQPTPAVVAPQPTPAAVAKDSASTDEKKPGEHKWVKKKPKSAEPSVARNEPTGAQPPTEASQDAGVEAQPTLAQPQPAGDSIAEKPTPAKAPVAVDVAPTPAPVAAPPQQLANQPTPADPGSQPTDEPALADRGDMAPAVPLADAGGDQVLPDNEYTKLPWAEANQRGPELVAELRRADERVLKGYELASRGAVYAARAEFISAIKIIAQAYDNQEGTRRYSRAATAGLTAIKEASDFVRTSPTLREVEISSVLVGHTTPVLKDSDTSDMPPIAAARCYYSYAQEQLSAAVGQEVCGSMALYAMGKVAVMSTKSSGSTLENAAQAMALYRAALIAYPKNFRAANELGVLLAQNGQYELARDLLIRSVVVSPQATTWKNLAAIHTRTGEHQMAERARQRALAMQQQGQDLSSTPAVQWVDPAVFASTSSATDALPIAPPQQSQLSAAKTATKAGQKPADSKSPPVRVAKKPLADWLKPESRQ